MPGMPGRGGILEKHTQIAYLDQQRSRRFAAVYRIAVAAAAAGFVVLWHFLSSVYINSPLHFSRDIVPAADLSGSQRQQDLRPSRGTQVHDHSCPPQPRREPAIVSTGKRESSLRKSSFRIEKSVVAHLGRERLEMDPSHDLCAFCPFQLCSRGRVHVFKYLEIQAIKEDRRRGVLTDGEYRRSYRKTGGSSQLSSDFRFANGFNADARYVPWNSYYLQDSCLHDNGLLFL